MYKYSNISTYINVLENLIFHDLGSIKNLFISCPAFDVSIFNEFSKAQV